ncbi:DUF2058 domain-containing protein [Chiayiivirga flava]|uniref:Uncharacterized protein YaiL (DUF2058 family) n=1 Tax=Chiayiivirga flava TaxID=659595 RepID=A0A7W8D4K2_9GAMM|nr:DUF2058 family protein [Chiayiivirga flava]MBB5206655.1 uncharacterized protein YaiL (DUF2058 family) [Chiayiivirga flava]
MTDSLKDQLLKLGFKSAPREERRPPPQSRPARHEAGKQGPQQRKDQPAQRATRPPSGGPRTQGEIDLAKAYAIRSQREKDERIAAEKRKQEEAARRREGKTKLAELLKTASRNVPEADIARHFEYGGKIRRVYVTAEQLRQVNAGELAVVQLGGRYHLVSPDDARAAEAMLAGALALLVDPDAPAPEVDYADPKYQVPDDLVW